MMDYSFHGWGDFVIDSVNIPNAYGRINYKKVNVEIEDVDHTIHTKLKGFRVYCSVTIWNSGTATDAELLEDLANVLNDISDPYYTIRPRYDSSQPANIRLRNMMLDSDFGMKDLSKTGVGQSLELRFKSSELVSAISTMYNDEVGVQRYLEDGTTTRKLEDGTVRILE